VTSRTLQAVAASLFLAAALSASHIPSAPPRLLSETGLYAGRGTTTIDPRNRPFSPQYPLWSDGAEKSRWIRLPEGTAIDTRNVDKWDFPEGTRFWKEFRFNGRKVETRFLRKNGNGTWTFASYAWNEDQSDAVLAPAEGLPSVAEIAPGKFHSIPAVSDCRACHDSDGTVAPSDVMSEFSRPDAVPGVNRTNILGFTALQLSTDRDPGAPHREPLADDMVTLRTLADEDLLEPARPELVAMPPRIAAPDARTRSVLGYLSTNCGSCHNQDSSIANLGLLMKASAAPSHPRTVAPSHPRTLVPSEPGSSAPSHFVKPTAKWLIPNVPESSSQYVTPGAPALSAILVRMKSRRPSTQMPPLGTVVPDKEGVALVTEWIENLTQ
jgi:hypothetical protein